jgi:electron transport complex protein RnfD
MDFQSPPYLLQPTSVQRVMLTVCAALLPAIAVAVWWFGPALLLNLAITSATALLFEAAMVGLRRRPVTPFVSDGSALLTAWLIALAFPATAHWWLLIVGSFFAIVVAKHLYGGLGQNPFNPAMIAYAVCIVSFPALMSQWPGVDATTSATPLDAIKTGLKLGEGSVSVAALQADGKIHGVLAGRGWEWVAGAYLLGGLLLLQLRIITWHVPVAFLAALTLLAGALWLWQPQYYASPLFHIFAGGSLLGAFFIATDPVSGATTPRGKLIFGAGAGALAYLIRVFGGFPDGVAFGVLLMNLCVPLIDMYTQPPVFGMKKAEPPAAADRGSP